MIGGIDIGYNFVKGRAGDRETLFPSVIAPFIEGSYSLGHVERRVLHTGGQAWVIGETDMLSYQAGRRDAGWMLSDMWGGLFQAALGELCHATGKMDIVTGLPLQHYAMWNEALKDLLPRHYTFRINDRSQQTITVDRTFVITQPYGALLDMALMENGLMLDNAWSTGLVGIAELGGNTFNMLTARAMAEVPEWTVGDNFGLLDALGRIAGDIGREYIGIEPKAREVATWIAGDRTFSYHGKPQSIQPYIDRHLAPVVELLVGRFSENWRQPGRLDGLLLAGGGAMVLGEIIRDRLGGEWPSLMIGNNRSVVNGYHKLARRLWE